MSFMCRGVLAVACCSLALETSVGEDKAPAPDPAIRTFVDYLGKNGITLEAGEGTWWAVTDPKGDGYKVVVSLKAFPAGTSDKDMRAALEVINLAYILNAPSRLAMSYPSLRISDPKKPAPKVDQIPVAAKLEKLFEEYRPPHPKK